MAWQITGGVANQPDVPRVEFGFGRNNGWFSAEIIPNGERVVSSPSQTEATDRDRVNLVSAPGLLARDYRIEPTVYPRPGCTNQLPAVSVTSNGGVRISAESPYKLETEDNGDGIAETVVLSTSERTLNLQVTGSTRTDGADASTFLRFVTGSLADTCESAVNGRIAGATTDMLPIFTDYSSSHAGGTYTRNPDCWIYDLRQAATCVSPWNSNAANRKAGVALTPRHIATAAHYEYPVGTSVRFVTADDITVTRTVVGKKRHPDYSPYYPDITLYLLDSDLPSTITPCKVLPADYETYLPTGPAQIAALCLDQEEKALVTDLSYFTERYAAFRFPDTPEEQTLYEGKITGDSGNPAFLIVGGELVCLTLWTYGGAGSGTFLTPQIAAMNQMIADLDAAASINTGYTIQTVDLSAYPSFA